MSAAAGRRRGFRIERDVGGVPGLLLAYELFSEDVERGLWQLPGWRSHDTVMGAPGRVVSRIRRRLSPHLALVTLAFPYLCLIPSLP